MIFALKYKKINHFTALVVCFLSVCKELFGCPYRAYNMVKIELDFNMCMCVIPGEHRGLGPSISKVRSLKMDKKVWTEELIQVQIEILSLINC